MKKLFAFWCSVWPSSKDRDAATLDDQLVQDLRQLWQSREKRDLEARHEFGRMLGQRLNTSDQRRQPYGAAVVKRLSEELDVSRTELHRMCKFARLFKTVADLKDACPEAVNWAKVKAELAKHVEANAKPSKRPPKDPSLAIWKRIGRNLDAIKADLALVPDDSKKELVTECQPQFLVVSEKFNKLLSTPTTDVQNSPVIASVVGGDTKVKNVEFYIAQQA